VALSQFRQVKELFPAHAYVGGYISRAQMAISQGKDIPVVPPRKPVPWTLIVIASGAAVIALGGGVFGYGLSRRSRRKAGQAEIEGAADPQSVKPDASAAERDDEDFAQMGLFDGGGADSTFGSAHADDGQDTTGVEDIDDIPECEPIDYIEGYPENRPAHFRTTRDRDRQEARHGHRLSVKRGSRYYVHGSRDGSRRQL
jgi:hypothetical protein